MNKKRFYILASTVLLIGLAAGVVQYVGAFDALYSAAKNPGHTWSEMECTDDLCIDAANHQIKVGDIQLKGKLCDRYGECGATGAILEFTIEGLRWKQSLTYNSSTHYEHECRDLGGTVFNTGTGTACRLPASSVPSGWTQAENWQRYNLSTWGGDVCGRYVSSASTTWSNALSTCYSPGTRITSDSGMCDKNQSHWKVNIPGYTNGYVVVTTNNCASERAEVGIY